VTEKAWQAQVVELATLYGWLVYHTYDSRRSNPGWPDLVLVRANTGEIVYAELKTDKGKTTPAQDVWLAALRACGQEAHVWRPCDFDAVHERLKRPRESRTAVRASCPKEKTSSKRAEDSLGEVELWPRLGETGLL
jgi:hypothetical protein